MKLYMFRTAPLSIIRLFHGTHSYDICPTGLLHVSDSFFLSIIRSFPLYKHQCYMSHRFATCFGQFFCPSSGVFHCTHSNGICHTGLLHVSDSSSVHHQQFSNVYTPMINVIQVCYMFRTVLLSIISSFSLYTHQWYMSHRFATCFGQFLCPSSAVFHCTHINGICHTGLLTACEHGSFLILLASCQQNCMTHTIAVFTVKNS